MEVTHHHHFTLGYSASKDSAQCFSYHLLQAHAEFVSPITITERTPSYIWAHFFQCCFSMQEWVAKIDMKKNNKILTCATQKRSDASSVSSAPLLLAAADGEDPLPWSPFDPGALSTHHTRKKKHLILWVTQTPGLLKLPCKQDEN